MAHGAGNLQLGIVNSWDSTTMTGEVTAFDGSGKYYNVGIMMQSCDVGNGAYSFTPPAIGNTCLFSHVSGEVVIVGQYAPPNLGDNSAVDSPLGATMNRSTEDMPNEDHLPGDCVSTSQSGMKITKTGSKYAIEMSPKFFSVWNMINNVWDTACDIFKFSSPAADVLVTGDGGASNVEITVRKSPGERGTEGAVNLKIGANAGLINLKINGKDFLHVDNERNVTLSVKNMTITGDCVNMEGVGRVKLP